ASLRRYNANSEVVGGYLTAPPVQPTGFPSSSGRPQRLMSPPKTGTNRPFWMSRINKYTWSSTESGMWEPSDFSGRPWTMMRTWVDLRFGHSELQGAQRKFDGWSARYFAGS